jgi:predicted nucleic acid-binding protein
MALSYLLDIDICIYIHRERPSHAKAERLRLVTNNEREFERIPGLNVENWVN